MPFMKNKKGLSKSYTRDRMLKAHLCEEDHVYWSTCVIHASETGTDVESETDGREDGGKAVAVAVAVLAVYAALGSTVGCGFLLMSLRFRCKGLRFCLARGFGGMAVGSVGGKRLLVGPRRIDGYSMTARTRRILVVTLNCLVLCLNQNRVALV